MAYTVQTVITKTQRKLDNTSFDSATLIDYANDTERELFNRYRIPSVNEREATSITTTNGSNALSGLPSTTVNNYLSFRIYTPINYAMPIPYIEYEDVDLVYPNVGLLGTGPPIAWTIYNGTPVLVNNADQTYTIRAKYLINPTELTSASDTPNVPQEYSELLVLGMYARALEHDDEFDKAAAARQQFDKLAIDYVSPRQSGTPHIMRQPRNLKRFIGRS